MQREKERLEREEREQREREDKERQKQEQGKRERDSARGGSRGIYITERGGNSWNNESDSNGSSR